MVTQQSSDTCKDQALQARRCGRGPVGLDVDAPEDLRSVRWLKGWQDADLGGFVFLGGRNL